MSNNLSTISSIFNKFYFRTIIVIIISIVTVLAISEVFEYNQRVKKKREAHEEYRRYVVKDEVNRTISHFKYINEIYHEKLDKRLKEEVDNLHNVISLIYNINKDKLPESEIKGIIKESLRGFRTFNGRGYVYCIDMNGVSVMHPVTPEYEGNSMMYMQDIEGRYIIKEEVELLKASKTAYFEYSWSKPEDSKNRIYKKRAYLRRFDPYNWYFGLGEYNSEFLKDLQIEALEWIQDLNEQNKLHIFINSFDGIAVQATAGIMNGDTILNLTDPVDGKNIFELEKKAGSKLNGDFVTLNLTDSGLLGSYESLSFVKNFDEWGWTVGAWSDILPFEQIVTADKSRLSKNIAVYTILTIVLIALLILILRYYLKKVNRVIETDFKNYSSSVSQSVNIGELIVNDKYSISEIHELASTTNVILSESFKNTQKVKQNKKNSELLLQNAPIVFITLDSNKKLTSYNNKFLSTFDLTTDDIGCNPSIHDVFREKVEPDSIKAMDDMTGDSDIVQVKLFNGNESYLSFISINISSDEIIWIGKDLTELIRIEAEIIENRSLINSLINSIPIPIFYKDVELKYMGCNKTFSRLINKEPEDIIGKYPSECFPHLLASKYEEKDRIILENQEPIVYDERLGFTEDADALFTFYKAPFYNLKGEFIGIIGAMLDITERNRRQEELRTIAASLESINNTKDKFFSIIAHDLKNPFNTLIGFSELLIMALRKGNFDKSSNFANIMKGSAEQGLALLENLLEWAKTKTGEIKYSPNNINVDKLLNNSYDLLKGSAQSKNIILKVESKIEKEIVLDKEMIKTVIRNLVTNAIKFTPNNGSIKMSAMEEENQIIFSVADNGLGMSQENVDKLFKIDHSFTTVGTNKEKGTGLGLILCHEFVEKHGGKIWVESKIGVGTTFSFSIPC